MNEAEMQEKLKTLPYMWDDDLEDSHKTPPNDKTTPNEAAPCKTNRVTSKRWAEINAFGEFIQRDLSMTERAVWLSVFVHTDTRINLSRVSQATLAEEAGCSIVSVKRAIKALVKKGLLMVMSKGNNITHESSVYRTISKVRNLG